MATYFHRIDPNEYYSIKQAMEIVGCSRESIRMKIKNKKLLAARIDNGPWRILGSSLAEMMAPLTAIQPQEVVPTRRAFYRHIISKLRD